MMLNSINLDSRISRPVRYSSTRNGSPMVQVAVANNRKDNTNYFDCVAFNKTADYIHNYAHVGQKMALSGVMNHRIINGHDYYSITILSVDLNRDKGTTGNGADDSGIQHNVNSRTPHYSSNAEIKSTVKNALSKMHKNS